MKTPKQKSGIFWKSTASLFLVVTIVLLSVMKCTSERTIKPLKKANQDLLVELASTGNELVLEKRNVDFLKSLLEKKNREIDSLESVINHYENLKPIALVTKITKPSEKKEIVIVDAVMAPKSSKYKSHVTFEYALCDSDSLKEENNTLKMEISFLGDVLKVALDSLNNVVNDSVEIALVKSTPTDTSVVARKTMAYYALLHNPISDFEVPYPVISDRPISEYTSLADFYRAKSEICFVTGLASGIASAGFYAISEAMGHPIFIVDPPTDNSAAQQKSNTIKGLRWVSAGFGALSAIQIARGWHYHRLEGKFIIYPTEYGAAAGISVKIPEIK